MRRRDRGVCALCGVDTRAQAERVAAQFGCSRRTRVPDDLDAERLFLQELERLRIPLSRWRNGLGNLWDMDHVVPVAKGGGSCGLDNLRTLCLACHRGQTATLKRELAGKQPESTSYRLF